MKSLKIGLLVSGFFLFGFVSPAMAWGAVDYYHYTHYTNAGCQVTLTLSTNQVLSGGTLGLTVVAGDYRSGWTTPGPSLTIPVEVLLDGEKVSTLNAPWHPYGTTPVAFSITNLTINGLHTVTIQHTNDFEYYNETVFVNTVYHSDMWGNSWYDHYYNVYHYRTVVCSDAENFTVLPLDAGFLYTTNNGAITITGYTGSGGQITIPSIINGLPVTAIGDNAFYNKTSLTGITFPGLISSIGSYAFRNCYGLTSMTIPGGVATINEGTFYYCTGLTNVIMGSNVTVIGERAFGFCSNLRDFTIPDSVTTIGNGAFSKCNGLTRVAVGKAVTSIGIPGFALCSGLTNISVDALNPSYSSVDGVLFNKNQTELIRFPGSKTGSYMIPGSVTNIVNGREWWESDIYQYGAFSECNGLLTVVIPDTVTAIGDFTFLSCTGLTDVTMGNGVASIGERAFSSCSGLIDMIIPDSVTAIGYSAFSMCTGLNTVTIGANTATIRDYAFYNCSNLAGIYFYGIAPALGGSSVFSGATGTTVYRLVGTSGWPAAGELWGGRPTALWNPNPSYQLTVSNGVGSGAYTNGELVTITASNAPSGEVFDVWTGDTQYVASVMSVATTVTMPAQDISVTATYRPSGVINFSDGFEGATLDPYWVASLLNGTINPSSARAHSGAQSVQFAATGGGQKYLHLRHFFDAPQRGTVTVWVYDSMEYIYFYVSLFNSAAETNGVGIGVQDWDTSAYYGPNGKSSVPRAVGWRKFTLKSLDNELVLSVDDQELYRSAGVDPFSVITLTVSGPGGGTIYFDDFAFENTGPDADGNGLPDWWEQQYFSGTGVSPTNLCANGINTVFEAYIAGINPTNPASLFLTSVVCPPSSENIIQWNAVSGRVYNVYWSTNLLSGFQCLESNIPWPQCSATNPASSPCGYYKIDIRLEE